MASRLVVIVVCVGPGGARCRKRVLTKGRKSHNPTSRRTFHETIVSGRDSGAHAGARRLYLRRATAGSGRGKRRDSHAIGARTHDRTGLDARGTPEPTATPEDATPEPEEEEEEDPDHGARSTQPIYSNAPQAPLPASPAAHPQGLDGCKTITLFGASSPYSEWCSIELPNHVYAQCSGLATEDERLQCGTNIVAEYASAITRASYARCFGIDAPGDVAEGCAASAAKDTSKVFAGLWDGWSKVQIGGNRDSVVVTAWKDTIACLEEADFKDVNPDLLFGWQNFDRPNDYIAKEDALTGPDKDLRKRIREPSPPAPRNTACSPPKTRRGPPNSSAWTKRSPPRLPR